VSQTVISPTVSPVETLTLVKAAKLVSSSTRTKDVSLAQSIVLNVKVPLITAKIVT